MEGVGSHSAWFGVSEPGTLPYNAKTAAASVGTCAAMGRYPALLAPLAIFVLFRCERSSKANGGRLLEPSRLDYFSHHPRTWQYKTKTALIGLPSVALLVNSPKNPRLFGWAALGIISTAYRVTRSESANSDA